MSTLRTSALPRQGDRIDEAALVELAGALKADGYAFTTVTPSTYEKVNGRPENARGSSLTDVFGWSRPFAAGELPERIVELMQRAGVLEESGGLLRSALRASTLRGELYFHSAFPTVAPDSVFFGPDTYRFAQAIEASLALRRPIRRAVDIGAGAGPGGVMIAMAHPGAEVLLTDVNDRALVLAHVNATAARAMNAKVLRSDLYDALDGDFDLIVANPPYLVDASRRRYRHGGGALGAELSIAIVQGAMTRLASGGRLLLYTGAAIVEGRDPFRAAVADILSNSDLRWSYGEIDPDVFSEELDREPYIKTDRIAAVVLTVDRQG